MMLLEGLNDEQKSAVETTEGALLVLAGAGSGKTRVVTVRIAYLIENGVSPTQILGLTFTNKAAREMQERIQKLTQHYVTISTFHSLGVRILRESIHHLGYQSDFTIYDADDSQKLVRACVGELEIAFEKGDIKTWKNEISNAKNALRDPDAFSGDQDRVFASVYRLYQKRLKEYNALDFDDLLILTERLFREHPSILEYYQDRWRYLLIDEYQDTNEAQYAIVKMLVAKNGNICVVGDPDQSIYSWRGANIRNILNFERDYPGAKVVRLERNYRSRSNILEAANALIGHNSNRFEKALWSDLGHGEKIKHFTGNSDRDEARYVVRTIEYHAQQHELPLKEMVIFYRTNAQSRVLEDYLLQAHVPYVIVGGVSFYQRREIKDILAFLRMVQSGSDFISFSRTINIPKRGIGNATLEKIQMGAAEAEEPILDFCRAVLRGERKLRLSSKQKEGLKEYIEILQELRHLLEVGSLKELVLETVEQTGYLSYLRQDMETFQDRKANVDELITKAAEWELSVENPTLAGFLEELSLKSTLDEADEVEDRVNLMTIHNGKGLEFQVVFLVGLEEDLFPHVNARGTEEAIEEERRLCYVGMTRAREFLYLTNCRMRFLWGSERTQRLSRFVKEVPYDYIEKVRSAAERRTQLWHVDEEEGERSDGDFIDDVGGGFGDDDEFEKGDKVFHQKFGIGIVQGVFQGSAGLMYKVFFTGEGRERLLAAKFSNLARL